MKKILFGTKEQAQDFANDYDYTTDTNPVTVNLSGFEGGEGAPDTFSGETSAIVARNADFDVVAYLAYWE